MLGRIARGRTDLIFEWLATGGAPGATVDGASLLQWAAYYGDVGALRQLMAHGAPLDPQAELNGAAFHGHWQLTAFLLECGADPNHPLADNGETPLHAALCRRDSVTHDRVVRVLLDAGADPNRTTTPGVETGCYMRDTLTRGETPLHRAATCALPQTIEALIAAGATIDARDAHGETPLAWASRALRDDTVLRLLCYGPYRINPNRQPMAVSLIGEP
ncbi:ankyrin repeat domain-containing protein [Sphingomonas gilva]|uniref:Ankyrin repeat domain-containing protein n=1 Tax=Sphingomonas gilva TaxID=2305907 RepID=A0A396S3D2_9SPHN|nr:ankyrin repeat domain-containing protein [Sphingomonas gilva]RHW17895.1 ankyrin repeat domain-containing protein [Sphingomonas gilva]